MSSNTVIKNRAGAEGWQTRGKTIVQRDPYSKARRLDKTKPELLLTFILLALLSTTMAAPDEASGIVVNVLDGGTFDVRIDKNDSRIKDRIERIGLADLLVLNTSSQEGSATKDFTAAILLKKTVWLDIDNASESGRGIDGRLLCVAYLSGIDGLPVTTSPFNRMLVDAGCAKVEDDPENEFDPENWWRLANVSEAEMVTAINESELSPNTTASSPGTNFTAPEVEVNLAKPKVEVKIKKPKIVVTPIKPKIEVKPRKLQIANSEENMPDKSLQAPEEKNKGKSDGYKSVTPLGYNQTLERNLTASPVAESKLERERETNMTRVGNDSGNLSETNATQTEVKANVTKPEINVQIQKPKVLVKIKDPVVNVRIDKPGSLSGLGPNESETNAALNETETKDDFVANNETGLNGLGNLSETNATQPEVNANVTKPEVNVQIQKPKVLVKIKDPVVNVRIDKPGSVSGLETNESETNVSFNETEPLAEKSGRDAMNSTKPEALAALPLAENVANTNLSEVEVGREPETEANFT